MADVRIGRDQRLGRTVAVKLLRTDLASDDTFHARFRREAQASAMLNHPAIVAVYDTGADVSSTGSNVPYIVMEYVEGKTLRDVLREGRKILPERALEITADVLSALDYSHRAGIVHRDIKPGNVMLNPAGQVKVMDFGIARAMADSSSQMTQTAAVVGTAQYLSPEQARGEQVDARSDIYSTGCLLYELLTGRPPFVGDSPVSVAYQHVREEAERPSHYNPEISSDIDAIVAKALAKRTDERYQSAAEMRSDIERHLAGQRVAAPAVVVGAGATTVSTAVSLPAYRDTGMFAAATDEEAPRRKTWPWVLLVLAVLAVLALGVWALLRDTGAVQPDQVSVPNVVGDPEAQAVTALRNDGFDVETETENSDDVDEGLVISQDPGGGDFQPEGTTVSLTVSAGEEMTQVPIDVEGMSFNRARDILSEAGLEWELVDRVDSSEPRNTVLSTDPQPGAEVPVGTLVEITASDGPIELPRVIGETEGDATAVLEGLDLTVFVDGAFSDEVDTGLVIDQSPEEGSTVSVGQQVVIIVSLGPEETEPTEEPTDEPTEEPTDEPTEEPTDEPGPGNDRLPGDGEQRSG